jgi:hypothetical protein
MTARLLVVAVIALAEVFGAHRAALLLAAAVAVIVIGYRLLRWLVNEIKSLAAASAKYAAGILLALAIGLSGHHAAAPASGPAGSYAGIAFAVAALTAIVFAAFIAQKMIREARTWRTAP